MNKRFLLTLAMVVMTTVSAWALPSLDPNDWEDVTVPIKGSDQKFTCIQDAQNPAMWYYVPKSPRLVENNGKPVFSLIKYQGLDENNKEKSVAGGILQFAINLSLPTEASTAIRKRIFELKSADWKAPDAKDKVENLDKKLKLAEKDLKLTCLPIASASCMVYDLGGNLTSSGGQMGGVAPTFANQDMVFQIKMSKLGTDIYNAMVNGKGGIPVTFSFAYLGISPKCGFTVEVDWDQTFTHYSSDEKTKKVVGCFLWSRTEEKRVQDVRENLVQNKCIKVNTLSGPAMPDDQIDKYLEPILKRINDEMLQVASPPEKIDPAQAPDAGGGGWFGGGGSSLSIKNVAKNKKGKEVFKFDKQKIIESNTSCGGFIGLSGYSDAIRKECITVVPPGNWAEVKFTLPAVGDDPRLNIKQVDLTVSMVDKDGNSAKISDTPGEAGQIPQQSVTWTPSTGYWYAGAAKTVERTVLVFPMQYIFEKFRANLRDFRFKVEAKITQVLPGKTPAVMTFVSYQPVIDGDSPVTSPLDCVETFTINAGLLTFKMADKTAPLKMLTANVAFKDESVPTPKTITLTASIMDPTKGTEVVFLVPRNRTFTSNVKFSLDKVGDKPWQYASYAGDLRDKLPTLDYMPSDGEWENPDAAAIDTSELTSD